MIPKKDKLRHRLKQHLNKHERELILDCLVRLAGLDMTYRDIIGIWKSIAKLTMQRLDSPTKIVLAELVDLQITKKRFLCFCSDKGEGPLAWEEGESAQRAARAGQGIRG